MDSASLFMSCTSASVGPSGRQIASRLSTTSSRARSWSVQVGSSLIDSSLHCHVETLDVEVVVGSDLVDTQAVLLRGVAVRARRAHPVRLLPVEDCLLDRRCELEAEPLEGVPDGSLRGRAEVAGVDVEGSVVAAGGALPEGVVQAIA